MQSSLRRKIKTEGVENISFTTQQVRAVRSSQEPCPTFRIFLRFSSDLSRILRLLLLLWFHPWPEEGLKDFPLSLCSIPCIARKSCPSQARHLEHGLGWRESQEGFCRCAASLYPQKFPRNGDRWEERCGKKDVVKIEVLHFRGWAAGTDLQCHALSSLQLVQAKVPRKSAWKMGQLYALLTQSQMTARSWNNKKALCISGVQGWQILPDVSVEHCNTQHLICFPLRNWQCMRYRFQVNYRNGKKLCTIPKLGALTNEKLSHLLPSSVQDNRLQAPWHVPLGSARRWGGEQGGTAPLRQGSTKTIFIASLSHALVVTCKWGYIQESGAQSSPALCPAPAHPEMRAGARRGQRCPGLGSARRAPRSPRATESIKGDLLYRPSALRCDVHTVGTQVWCSAAIRAARDGQRAHEPPDTRALIFNTPTALQVS